MPLNILKSQPGGFCWYLCVHSSTRRSYKDGMIQGGRLLWRSLVQLPAQSKATFEGKSVCTTSQVSDGVFGYNLQYFGSFSIRPCEWRTKRRVLGSVPPQPALLRGAGLGRGVGCRGHAALLPPAQSVVVQSAGLLPRERGLRRSTLLSGGGVGDLPDTGLGSRDCTQKPSPC